MTAQLAFPLLPAAPPETACPPAPRDTQRIATQLERVRALMATGRWYTLAELDKFEQGRIRVLRTKRPRLFALAEKLQSQKIVIEVDHELHISDLTSKMAGGQNDFRGKKRVSRFSGLSEPCNCPGEKAECSLAAGNCLDCPDWDILPFIVASRKVNLAFRHRIAFVW